ncbi:MAG: glycosyltransferase family 4 protein [Phycisphaerae bacterium]|nr:glycosyltransferase family 4 protein [Phycisphaerae bacterium]
MERPPALAIIANSYTPYRAHLHRRIAREIPEYRLLSVFTHETSDSPWTFTAPPEINPISFGHGESIENQSRLTQQSKEWRRGGRIIQFLREHHVRAIVMMGYNDLGRVRILRWCHRHGVRRLLFGDSNIRGDRASGVKKLVKQSLLHRVLAWCDGVLVCGSLGKEYFEEYGADSDRIFYFPYEPDYEQIQGITPGEMRAVAEQFHISSDHRYLIYSGRLAQAKRVDLLIDAFARIAHQRPLWNLIIVGDGPLRESLQPRVPVDLRSRVIWTGFLGDQRIISALYRLGDVLVLPSDYEPWGLVINEATAAGMAIVASDVVGAAAELVRDGINGRIFSHGSMDGLSKALLAMTDAQQIERYKMASGEVLADWRRRADPVVGLRKALEIG